MNTKHFSPLSISFEDMFNMQRDLMFRYRPEFKDFKFDVDNPRTQELLKERAWCITEELTEMLEAYYKSNIEGPEHVWEEAIDAFNFFIEFLYMLGYSPEEHPLLFEQLDKYPMPGKNDNRIEETTLDIIYYLGMVCNLFKARKWRESQYLVDIFMLRKRVKILWQSFLILFLSFEWTEKDICDHYSLKYQVNNFRLQSNY